MKYPNKILFPAALFLLICILSGCALSNPTLPQQTTMPGSSTAPTSTTATTAPTSPTESQFDPAALAAQIPENMMQEMKQIYREQFYSKDPNVTPENVYMSEVFAIFNETYVMFVDVAGYEHATMSMTETINGVEFRYTKYQSLVVYAQGHYYTLQEAFDAQILNGEDLVLIADNYYNAYPVHKP